MRVKEESEKSGLKLNIQKTKIMESHPITSWWTEGGKVEAVTDFIFFELQNHCRWQPYNKKILVPWKVSYDKPRKCIKKQRNHFADKGPSSQNYGFSSSHILMWELDHKEGWEPKNWCFQTVVLEKIWKWVPWTERRWNQSILKEINPEYSLERLC